MHVWWDLISSFAPIILIRLYISELQLCFNKLKPLIRTYSSSVLFCPFAIVVCQASGRWLTLPLFLPSSLSMVLSLMDPFK